MELPETVEWAVHCCWLLAQTDGSPVPRRRLAEFFDLPEPYLAKLLKALVAADVLISAPGVNGGYRLARPAAQITVLDVVRGVNGHATMFHCAEIRQRGPVGLAADQCRQPCGIAKVMYGAELAWRNALAAATVADLIENAAGVSADRAARWLGAQAKVAGPVPRLSRHQPDRAPARAHEEGRRRATPYPIQFGSGDWITVVTRATGTFTGAMTLPDGTVIPPTGKAFDVEFGQTTKWEGDQLIVISAFFDPAVQARQLGLS
jgi:Rrf2 family protein